MCKTKLLFLLILSFFATRTNSQTPDLPVKKWVRMLSVREDPLSESIRQVATDIMKLDTTAWCHAYAQLVQAASGRSGVSSIRTTLLLPYLQALGMSCPKLPPLIEVLSLGLQEAYEIEDEALQYELHIRLGQAYNGERQFDMAAFHYHQLFDILKQHEVDSYFLPANVYSELNFSLYYAHDYTASIRAGLNALNIPPEDPFSPDDTLEVFQQMLTWNTIGLAFHKMHNPDSAFIAFERAEHIARLYDLKFWTGIISGNKGDVFFDLGQYDTAYSLLHLDFELSLEFEQFDNAANSLQWLARIDHYHDKPNVGLRKLYEAQAYLKKKPQPNYQANIYQAFSQVYTTLGRADSVSLYQEKYLHLHDSLQAEISKSRTDILQMRLNNQDQINMIKMLNRQKHQVSISRNFMIALVFLLACITYLWYLRKRQEFKARQELALKEKQIAKAEAQKAIGQLDIYRQNLMEKNALIEKWQEASEAKAESEEFDRRVSDLTHHLILSEEDWFQFKSLFDSVYPGFFMRLRNEVPDITQAEQRMAALSKLRLTAKEAANLLGVSPNTIYKTRQRLRQRLGLGHDSDLDPYFADGTFQ